MFGKHNLCRVLHVMTAQIACLEGIVDGMLGRHRLCGVLLYTQKVTNGVVHLHAERKTQWQHQVHGIQVRHEHTVVGNGFAERGGGDGLVSGPKPCKRLRAVKPTPDRPPPFNRGGRLALVKTKQ